MFSRREKVPCEEFCRDFYERFVFAPDIAGVDPHRLFSETTLRLITDVDSSFSSVSLHDFASNLLLMRLEVANTAWSHASKDIIALKINEFTKSCLLDSDRESLWIGMLAYNQAIEQSATYGADPNTRTGRFRITFVNDMRTRLFDEWIQKGHDSEAAARTANRLGTEPM